MTSLLHATSTGILTTAPETLYPRDNIQHSMWLDTVGYGVLVMAKAIASILVWTLTFITFALPTVLFDLFSTSLTVTMNFTTL